MSNGCASDVSSSDETSHGPSESIRPLGNIHSNLATEKSFAVNNIFSANIPVMPDNVAEFKLKPFIHVNDQNMIDQHIFIKKMSEDRICLKNKSQESFVNQNRDNEPKPKIPKGTTKQETENHFTNVLQLAIPNFPTDLSKRSDHHQTQSQIQSKLNISSHITHHITDDLLPFEVTSTSPDANYHHLNQRTPFDQIQEQQTNTSHGVSEKHKQQKPSLSTPTSDKLNRDVTAQVTSSKENYSAASVVTRHTDESSSTVTVTPEPADVFSKLPQSTVLSCSQRTTSVTSSRTNRSPTPPDYVSPTLPSAEPGEPTHSPISPDKCTSLDDGNSYIVKSPTTS